MNFENPEVIELGAAEELIQDTMGLPNTEGTAPAKYHSSQTIYVTDAE